MTEPSVAGPRGDAELPEPADAGVPEPADAGVPEPADAGVPEPADADLREPTEAPPPSLAERFENRVTITLPTRHNPRLAEIVERVNEDDAVYALWVAANVNAVDRLRMSDHGPVHVQIVANSALRILRLLITGGVVPSSVRDYGLEPQDAEVIVALAALFHDVGMSIHREGHEDFSLFIATPIVDRLLASRYDTATATIIRSEILHAIISHRSGGTPLTVEGGILRVADALDMARGRSRIPFTAGSTSIHSVSAAAIEAVRIEAGDTVPVRILVQMSNSAGVFQVDELLRRKLRGSGLETHILVEAHIEGETEKRLVQRFRL